MRARPQQIAPALLNGPAPAVQHGKIHEDASEAARIAGQLEGRRRARNLLCARLPSAIGEPRRRQRSRVRALRRRHHPANGKVPQRVRRSLARVRIAARRRRPTRLHEDVGETAIILRERRAAFQERFGLVRATGSDRDFHQRRQRFEPFAGAAGFLEAPQGVARERFRRRVAAQRNFQPGFGAVGYAQPMASASPRPPGRAGRRRPFAPRRGPRSE